MSTSYDISDHELARRRELSQIGSGFYNRHWSVGTSSNYSVVLSDDPYRLLITASGKDKGRLGDADFVVVDATGKAVDDSMPKPSAETMLHVVLGQRENVGAVLHTHSVWATVLSDLHAAAGELVMEGYEMLKGLDGVRTHEHRQAVRVYENTQDIARLSQQVSVELDAGDPRVSHGFLMRNHGLYTWGTDLEDARRHVEILEFLFEVIGRRSAFELARPDLLATAAGV